MLSAHKTSLPDGPSCAGPTTKLSLTTRRAVCQGYTTHLRPKTSSDTKNSKLGSRHQGQVRQDGQCPSLARHKRHALPTTILVLASSTVLAATRMGSWLRRMAPRIPKGPQGQHQHPALGHCMCQRHFHVERSHRCGLCLDHQAPRHADRQARAGATSIQERRSSKHGWSGQEGIVNRGIAHDRCSDKQRELYLWHVSQHFDARSSKQSSETATRVR